MINSTKEKSLFSRGTTRNSYLFVTESTIDQFRLYWGVLNTPIILSFMLLLPETCQIQGIPIRLNEMTVSHSKTVKNKNFDQITHRSILGFLIV